MKFFIQSNSKTNGVRDRMFLKGDLMRSSPKRNDISKYLRSIKG